MQRADRIKLDCLERRVSILESGFPTSEDAKKRRLDEFLSKCSDEELGQLIKIT